jgi:hypothetical protein
LSSALLLDEQTYARTTFRLICANVSVLVWERCTDVVASFGSVDDSGIPSSVRRGPGFRRFDALEVSLQQLFVLQSPAQFDKPSAAAPNTVSDQSARRRTSHSLRQYQQRVEISVIGLSASLFDQCTPAPLDAFQARGLMRSIIATKTSEYVNSFSFLTHTEAFSGRVLAMRLHNLPQNCESSF